MPQTSASAEVVMAIGAPAEICPTTVGLARHVNLDRALSRRHDAH
jgi:hypothetical protein